MKTAISLPDDLFQEAEALAERLHYSRSKLYAVAIQVFIRDNAPQTTTLRVKEFIAEYGQPVDPILNAGAIKDMRNVEW
jgi:metal-responsive CopG/Arc/MetJ family transcriptional regulator